MTKQDQQFIDTVVAYYKQHGRHDLPWRQTTSPYRIVVSEIMLQQTQVSRVEVKYREFLRTFPNTKQLAEAPLADVLRVWQGLGYNRRAKQLQTAATTVHTMHAGRWPCSYEGLVSLPGIGPYTAGAVMAFAYNKPVPIIETNIRTVILHHYFPKQIAVSDTDIYTIVARTLQVESPRQWYWALMDYGSYLKSTTMSRNQQSKHYQKQSTFKGSHRQARGAVVRLLGSYTKLSKAEMRALLPDIDTKKLEQALASLAAEGMLLTKKQAGNMYYRLPE